MHGMKPCMPGMVESMNWRVSTASAAKKEREEKKKIYDSFIFHTRPRVAQTGFALEPL